MSGLEGVRGVLLFQVSDSLGPQCFASLAVCTWVHSAHAQRHCCKPLYRLLLLEQQIKNYCFSFPLSGTIAPHNSNQQENSHPLWPCLSSPNLRIVLGLGSKKTFLPPVSLLLCDHRTLERNGVFAYPGILEMFHRWSATENILPSCLPMNRGSCFH